MTLAWPFASGMTDMGLQASLIALTDIARRFSPNSHLAPQIGKHTFDILKMLSIWHNHIFDLIRSQLETKTVGKIMYFIVWFYEPAAITFHPRIEKLMRGVSPLHFFLENFDLGSGFTCISIRLKTDGRL